MLYRCELVELYVDVLEMSAAMPLHDLRASIFFFNFYRHILKSNLIVTDNSKTSNSRARVALGAAKTTATMPYYGRIVLHYM